jgi:hypothetical protein
MASYVTCELKGGLGNQLFQIGCVFRYAEEYQKTPIFNTNTTKLGKRCTYWQTLFNSTLNNSIYNTILFPSLCNEREFQYKKLPLYSGNVKLNGYFQSEKYMPENKDVMYNLVHSNNLLTDQCKVELNKIKQHFSGNGNELVCMHIRRGDYLMNAKHHTNLTLSYYKNSLQIIATRLNKEVSALNVVVFSDEIDWCKAIVPTEFNCKMYFVDLTLCDGLKESVELLLLIEMTHYVIANSTFSWWGAYLNRTDSPDKIICCPKVWFGPQSPQDWQDIYFKNAIIVD